jgi:hypothetical protein
MLADFVACDLICSHEISGLWELNRRGLSRSAAMKCRDLQCSGEQERDKMGRNYCANGGEQIRYWRHFW